MIVLDEQLLGRDLDSEIARWYPGNVRFVIDLRPGTVIKDDAIPALLREQSLPTFVTINVRDFWRKVEPDRKYCIVCVDLPDSRVREIPGILRSLLRTPDFRTKRKRMGKIVRTTAETSVFYSIDEKDVQAG